MTRNVGIVVYEDAEELDWVGPYEVFTMLDKVVPGSCSVFTIGHPGTEVAGAKGLRVLTDHNFVDAPGADVVIIPGGVGSRTQMKDPAMLDFVRKAAGSAEVVASVCTGALILAAAGLLEGRRATTHFASMDRLRAIEGVTAVEERWVDEGNVVTAAGVSAGIDMALHLVGRLWSAETAALVQKWMQYYPSPPRQDVALPEWSTT